MQPIKKKHTESLNRKPATFWQTKLVWWRRCYSHIETLVPNTTGYPGQLLFFQSFLYLYLNNSTKTPSYRSDYFRIPKNSTRPELIAGKKSKSDDTGGDRGGGDGGVHGVVGEGGGAGVSLRPCPETGSFSHSPYSSFCFFSP